MATVIVERRFDAPREFEGLQGKEAAVNWCFETHGVRARRSFLSRDRLTMVCFYDAPDAEAVRATQRTAQMPVQHCWTATPIIDGVPTAPPGYSLVVAQRALPEGITLEMVQHLASDPNGCNQRLRLSHFGAFLALDCRRMCCVYYTPDLESVRVANREMGAPIESLWNAELISIS